MCLVLMNIPGNPSRYSSLNLMRIIKLCIEVGAWPRTMNKTTLTVITKNKGKKRRVIQILVSTQENNFCYLLSCQFSNYLHRMMGDVPKAGFLGYPYKAWGKSNAGKIFWPHCSSTNKNSSGSLAMFLETTISLLW